MRIRLNDYREYTSKAPPYENGLIFVQSGLEQKDVDCLLMWLRRLCDANEGLSFMLVLSTHKSKGNIQKTIIYTGKPGRPKTKVYGKKTERHCHGLIVNENANNNMNAIREDLRKYCKKRRQKRPNLKRQRIMDLWKQNLSIIKYMERQADSTHIYGNFDFDYFKNPYYFVLPEENNYFNILDF